MTPHDAPLDLLGIGNAIVDVLAHSEEDFLSAHALPKGAMTLIDAERAERLYGEMGPGVEVSGGSCANTVAGAASMGSRVAYVGKVRDDELGRIFAHDIRAAGVSFDTPPANDGETTARCLILVTSDAQRTMCTYLGASTELGPEDVDRDLVASAAITYLEGYLWDPPRAKEAFRVAMRTARQAGRRVALTLSDPFCVERHRGEFVELVDGAVDILFANEHELCSLYTTGDDLDAAVAAVRGRCEIAVVTLSERGSLVITDGVVHEVPAVPVRVVDTTGAGDLYAAGFLHGLAAGMALPECARVGAVAAAEVISHFGARPEADLSALISAP